MESDLVIKDEFPGKLIWMNYGQAKAMALCLPMEIAWHVGDFSELEALSPLVCKVDQDFERNILTILYSPNVKALDEAQLQAMIGSNSPLEVWKFLRLALDLCECMQAFHLNMLPQGWLYPGRVALFEKKYVFLPGLAGALPSFTAWPEETPPIWLDFIAPEILRTRAVHSEELYIGDVYSLAQILIYLANPSNKHESEGNIYQLLEMFVERPGTINLRTLPPALQFLSSLFNRMCAFSPRLRPTLEEVHQELIQFFHQFDPFILVEEAIAEKRLKDAKLLLDDLLESQAYPVYSFPKADIHLAYKKAALSENPPDYPRAIDHLEKALRSQPQNIMILLEIAHTYMQYQQHPQHLLFAENAYMKAASLSNWRKEIVDEWATTLAEMEADRLIEQTLLIPWENRTEMVFAQRAASFLSLGQAQFAWIECSDYFQKFGFNAQVFDIAQRAALYLPPLELLRWLTQKSEVEHMDALISISWARNGNMEMASQYLERAFGSSLDKKE